MVGKPSAADLDQTIAQVRGVYASCVVLDHNADVGEIHIVASAARRPKQLIRDIETLLRVKHNLKVDYRKISLVQVHDENSLRLPVARPIIQQITEETVGNRRRIRVELRGASRIVIGEASENADNPTSLQTAAQATINAVQKLIGRYLEIQLSETNLVRLGTREIILVIVTCFLDNREETLVGASFMSVRPVDSTVRATLDALNRRIHNLLTQAPRQTEESDAHAV